MTHGYDVIIAGGGMLGLATAHHLASRGARTLVLESGDLGGGSSGACTGRAQTAEGHLDPLNLRLIREGFACFEHLAEELGESFEWRRNGFLALIDSEHLWKSWTERATALTAAGLKTQLVDQHQLKSLEPFLDAGHFLGAAYSEEGLLNPFRFCSAYAHAARRKGAEILTHTRVTGLSTAGGKVTEVATAAGSYSASCVALMAGAWTASLARLAGVTLPIQHTHAEAFVTEPVQLTFGNTVQLASFYETIHGKERAVSAGFSQDGHRALIVTEAVSKTTELHRRTSAWGVAGVAGDLLRLYPGLKRVRVVRGWGIPTPFSPDDEPLVGWAPGCDNLFVAAAFMQTITVVPLVTPWIAGMLLGEAPPVDLSLFDPARFLH